MHRPRTSPCAPVGGLALAALLLLGSCAGSGATRSQADRNRPTPGGEDFYAGTPEMQATIRTLLAEVPASQGAERIALARRIVSFGEPAVPILMDTLSRPDAELRGQAAWMLGFLGDPRSADALARAAQGDADRLVRYEAATSLVRMDDARGLSPLVAGLEDPDPRVRAKCLLVLQERTGETFGFRPDDPPQERAAAVARWRAWAEAMRRSRS